ncbi:hypothetical protein L2E82_36433 [Cichorium intybus]|uniref:Uncharacterized protein n=1 Tax=Cichorium intybus TaxID=13427 RepID=A0ACB9BRN6_CICIN|nr:hypothetical protein L2E82_36433 [Cichorium intybus]
MTKTRSESKGTDLEQELLQYKEENEERIKKLEGTMDAMMAESEKRHVELMNLMLQQARSTAPSPSPPPATVMPPLITAAIPTPTVGFSTSYPYMSQPSHLVFDEQGYPMPTYSENHSSNKGPPIPFRTQGKGTWCRVYTEERPPYALSPEASL